METAEGGETALLLLHGLVGNGRPGMSDRFPRPDNGRIKPPARPLRH